MNAFDVLDAARRLGITLVPAGDSLRFHPASRMTPELLAGIKRHKTFLLLTLGGSAPDVLAISEPPPNRPGYRTALTIREGCFVWLQTPADEADRAVAAWQATKGGGDERKCA